MIYQRLGAWLVAIVMVLAPSASAQHGVTADASVEPLDAVALRAADPGALWQALDGAEYWAIPRDPPDDYYAGADLSSASALRSWLHARIAGHASFPYTHSSRPGQSNHQVDAWDIVAIADAHPLEVGQVLDVYKNDTLRRQLTGVTSGRRYDREHSWPKSLGFPDQDPENHAYSDCHHLFAAFQPYNASRSNKPYGEAEPDPALKKPTEENVDRGGALMDDPEGSNYSFRDRWQTWIGRRGDLARAMFYMDVRYDGDANEPDLVLTDDISKIEQRNVWRTGGTAFMGLLPTLIKWHMEDPVDDLERRRNAVVFLFQGNRNPFVDHPEWVGPVFDNQPISTVVAGGGTPSAGPAVWINELHYDNQGADEDEFIEVCGAAGTSLVGWKLILYNGEGGLTYRSIDLSGSLPGQLSGFGTAAFAAPGLQNGEADGVALIDVSDRVVEFLSYEGRFTASDGPAGGVVSNDIGQEESGTTPKGHSLQRRGQGRTGAAFQWAAPNPATRGQVNQGQTF